MHGTCEFGVLGVTGVRREGALKRDESQSKTGRYAPALIAFGSLVHH